MSARRCPDCDFIFLGEDAPEEGCPECGAVWFRTTLETAEPNPATEIEQSATPPTDRDPQPAPTPEPTKPHASSGISRRILFALLAALIVTSLGWMRESVRSRRLQNSLTSVSREHFRLEEEFETTRDRLQSATTKLLAEQKATQFAEDEYKKLVSKYQNARAIFKSERSRLVELEHSLSALWEQHGHSHIRSWQIVGPFPFEVPSRGETTLSAKDAQLMAVENEIVNRGFVPRTQFVGVHPNLSWKPFVSDHDRIDLTNACDTHERLAAFAISWVFNRHERDAILSVGSDDGMKLWFNRELIRNVDTERSSSRGQERIPVTLQAGWNEIIMRVDNRGGGDWNFYAEFRMPDKKKEELKLFHTWIEPQTLDRTEYELD